MIPVTVPDEARLASLRKLNILDTPLEEKYERLTRMACKMLEVPIAAFTLVDDKRQWFKSIQGLKDSETDIQLSFCAHVASDNKMLLVPDAKTDERFFDHPSVTGGPNIGFYAGCPVHAPDGQAIGSICAIDTKPRDLDPEQLQILRDLAQIFENEMKVTALSKAQDDLVSELDVAQRLALIDPMTRLWNRAGMAEIVNREWAKALRNKTTLTFVMCDIDHFKKVNDTYGHPVGDEVIQTVGKRLLAALRTEDAIGRMGGEEFLLLMPDCRIGQVRQTVERIREALISQPVPTAARSLDITLSYGVATYMPDGTLTAEDIIKKADDALYIAKKSGRNRVEVTHA
jgi:diguanylate cyclase (GGDEF)-like protein